MTARLHSYFRSGWAFLIPYLGFYLLYAWQRWPVNPGSLSRVPALLHVFWGLHCLHAVAAAGVFARHWAACAARGPGGLRELGWSLAPWGLLALSLYLPGAYLEFPADAWAHLARITEWNHAREVFNHSVWAKSSYFTAYSLLGWLPQARLVAGVDLYQGGCGLLLLWNYYRLGQQAGLQRPGAFVFAALQPLFFGNGVFTFLRYYGLSSTLFAQLGVVALLRVALVVAGRWPARDSIGARWRTLGSGLGAGGLLAALIYFNHLQGIPLAALGLLAVAAWQVAARWPESVKWLAGAALVAAVAALVGWPRHPGVAGLQQASWLNFFHGFNLLAPSSPAFARSAQILGWFGALNLVAACGLLFRNRPAAWLTVTPVLVLLHPLAAIPLANYFAARSPADIVVFHRLFLAIPCGLALVALVQEVGDRATPTLASGGRRWAGAGYGVLLALLLLGLTLPAGGPWFSRPWHALAVTPGDLALRAFQQDAARFASAAEPSPSFVAGSSGLSVAFNVYLARNTLYDPLTSHRLYHMPGPRSPAGDLERIEESLAALPGRAPTLLLGRTADLLTPYSTAAVLSRHWLPQEAALTVAGRPELARRKSGPDDAAPQAAIRPGAAAPGLIAALRPVATGGDHQLGFAAVLPGLPPLETGSFRIHAELSAAGDRTWANLIMIPSTGATRGIYLYLRRETGALHYEFFEQTAGPFPAEIRPGGAAKKIEFTWSEGHQRLLVDGHLLAETHFAVPHLAAATGVRVGWIQADDPDAWQGTLEPESLDLGGVSPAPAASP
jgi:hypothetical protein